MPIPKGSSCLAINVNEYVKMNDVYLIKILISE